MLSISPSYGELCFTRTPTKWEGLWIPLGSRSCQEYTILQIQSFIDRIIAARSSELELKSQFTKVDLT